MPNEFDFPEPLASELLETLGKWFLAVAARSRTDQSQDGTDAQVLVRELRTFLRRTKKFGKLGGAIRSAKEGL